MRLTKTEQLLKQLGKKFKTDLIAELSKHGHVETGRLNKSIEITFNKVGEQYSLSLSALEYISFLEDGEFMKKFIKDKTNELSTALGKAGAEDIKNNVVQEIKSTFTTNY